ncbi:transposase [Bathymodiolus japonicus methanotrophic gill symbiont]|uniref:transposase n=1 Tax=Bathymodiolus japonicus methanotrophic gill symbiont TaxID=113269 RepID=UPI001C8D1FB5|nr:transposase [Bathymodiolus japonicus methanotrophic gill symbiont]
MLMNAPATFIQSYIDDLNDALNQLKPGAALTRIQAAWLGTCLTGILLMNSVCWAKFERASLGDCKVAALSWVFRKASIPWDWLLRVSVVLILKRYGITEGVLAFDESDRARSKSTKRIYKVYKQKHKGSGGYVNGQTIVLLLLVTSSITVPVGFFFYMPDTALKQWDKEDKRLKKSGIAKKDRPIKPAGAPCYLTKFRDSCRHNSFTYAADGRCPERPASATTTHKSRFVITTSLAGRLFGMQFLLLSRAASTRRISELPCRLSGTKNHHFAKLRFHDFQRT